MAVILSPWFIQTVSVSPVLPMPSSSSELLRDENIGAAELAVMAGLDLAAELFAHRHLAIADAEHRHAELEHLLRRARRVGFGNAGRTTGEDDRPGRARRERGFGLVVRHDLAIDARLTHAPRDELGNLRAEIDD